VVSGTRNGSSVFEATYRTSGEMETRRRDGVDWRFDFDAEGRLLAIHRNQEEVRRYIYDDGGQRLREQHQDGTVVVHMEPSYEETRKSDGAVLRTAYGDDDRSAAFAMTSGTGSSARTLFLHRDRLSSTLLTTDASGALVNRLIYDPFGKVIELSGPDDLRPKYTSKELDAESGLYDYESRNYDPELGRFMSADDGAADDDETTQDTYNRYAYTVNLPTVFNDPDGHFIQALLAALPVILRVSSVFAQAGLRALPSVGRTLVSTLTRSPLSTLRAARTTYRAVRGLPNVVARRTRATGTLTLRTKPARLRAGVRLGHSTVQIRARNARGVLKTRGYEQIINPPPGRVVGLSDELAGGFPTSVERIRRAIPATYRSASLRVSMKRAQAAVARAKALKRQANPPPYHVINNSCTTNCADVLRAAGLDPPAWANTPDLLHNWFLSIGATP
jgi:RHS repeat-associated protein